MLWAMYAPINYDTHTTRLASATERTTKTARSHDIADSASLMPVERQTAGYVEPAEPVSRIFSEHSGLPISQIGQHVRHHHNPY